MTRILPCYNVSAIAAAIADTHAASVQTCRVRVILSCHRSPSQLEEHVQLGSKA